MPERDYLRRLDDSFYRGDAFVHWTHTIDERKRGWLTSEFHRDFRELLLHASAKFEVCALAYALMPDHIHLLWRGMNEASDQKRATPWLRRRVNRLLSPSGCRLQQQAYDHVLRPQEKDRFALEQVAHYIWANPEQAGMGESWPYRGSMIPGNVEMSWTGEMPDDFWERWFE